MTDAFDIDAFLSSLSREPGVYRMFGEGEALLYVGKARNLRNRVTSYFRGKASSLKTAALVERILRIEVTVTLSETEALLLEQTLIKQHKPPYNILLRDDKSYPYIHLSNHEFPRISYHRGTRKENGQYFGPYPSSTAVRETLNWLEKTFRLRPCDDVFYRNRTRPCLKYQIGRCSGPCVGAVSVENYADQVRLTQFFLQGRNDEITTMLGARMEEAASRLDFEEAARWRDQIAAIRHVQEQQYADRDGGNADVFGVAIKQGLACVQVLFVRGGRVLGGKSHYQNAFADGADASILDDFLPQFYLGGAEKDIPDEIVVDVEPEFSEVLSNLLIEHTGRKVRWMRRVTGVRAGWLRLAQKNAEENLDSHLANRQSRQMRSSDLWRQLGYTGTPGRIECFDISHTQGERPVASCVVFDAAGPVKSLYKRFNIRDVTPGDDYAAIHQAVLRRYEKVTDPALLPSLIMIDGGKGQLGAAVAALETLGVSPSLLLGIAKGPSRKPGLEVLFTVDRPDGFTLPRESGGALFMQQIRDEAHRFAITGHRAQRGKARMRSGVEDIPGIGPARRKQLLQHFGGMSGLKNASKEEIARVKGINAVLADSIYAALHSV